MLLMPNPPEPAPHHHPRLEAIRPSPAVHLKARTTNKQNNEGLVSITTNISSLCELGCLSIGGAAGFNWGQREESQRFKIQRIWRMTLTLWIFVGSLPISQFFTAQNFISHLPKRESPQSRNPRRVTSALTKGTPIKSLDQRTASGLPTA